VDLAFRNKKGPASLAPYKNLEIEHILLDNPKNDLLGTRKAENPNADYDVYKNRLGNLTLLGEPHNIVASSGFFEKKKALYTVVNRINTKLETFTTWNSANIDKRHALLLALAQDVWKTRSIAA
jgi:hypothetical protein